MNPITPCDRSRTVAHVFNLMDDWRHLPGYRLEARAAPFFALYLRDVLSARLDVKLHPIVVPEFPLRIGTLDPDEKLAQKRPEDSQARRQNLSYNVDYVAFSDDRETAFLVELKTDMSSIDKNQEAYLRLARDRKLGPLVRGIVEICENSKKRSKYVHLLHLLANLELVSIPDRDKLYRMTFPIPRAGWTNEFKEVKPTVDGKLEHTRVIYIQPRESNQPVEDFEYIFFDEVADVAQRLGDLGCIFANFLRQWTTNPGTRKPRDMDLIS